MMTNYEKLNERINEAAEDAAEAAANLAKVIGKKMIIAGYDCGVSGRDPEDVELDTLEINGSASELGENIIKAVRYAVGDYQRAITADMRKIIIDTALSLAIKTLEEIPGKSFEDAAFIIAKLNEAITPEVDEKLEAIL